MTTANAVKPDRFVVAGPAGIVSALRWPAPGSVGLPPVLLLHPVNTGAEIWREVAPLLGREVVAVDYRGHGESDPGPRYLPADFARDALAVLDELGWPRVHLVGGSIGGAVAVELTALVPERVASIALFGATLHLGLPPEVVEEALVPVRELGVDEAFREHGELVVGPRALPGSGARFAEVGGGRDIAVVEAIVRTTFGQADSRGVAATLAPRPTLVAVGTDDPTCPPEMAAELAGALRTEVTLLEGLGHLPMVERPEEVAALIIELQGRADSS